MTTIYMKSADGKSIGTTKLIDGSVGWARSVLAEQGFTEISEVEFRTMKKEILRRMTQPEKPQPSNA
jgi:hypothetical protein